MIKFDEAAAKELIKSFNIPAQPAILYELQTESAKATPSVDAIADIIIQDVALSSKVLKLVNSPMYGLSRSVTDIKQSIVFLGMDNIKILINYFMIQSAFSGSASISLERFWDSSVKLAQIASIAIQLLNMKKAIPIEDIYASALFQDCGIPPMAIKYTDYKAILADANASIDEPFTRVEDRYYQTNHATIGFYVTSSWYLPKELCQYVLLHHERNFLDLNDISSQNKHIFALLKICSNVLNRHMRLEDEAEWLALRADVLDFLGLSDDDYEALEADISDVLHEHAL